MVYRRSRILSRQGYLGGAAHPSVFEARGIALGRAVALANGIAPDAVPPLANAGTVTCLTPVLRGRPARRTTRSCEGE